MFAIKQNITFQHIEEFALSASRLCVILTPHKNTNTEHGNKLINIQIQQIVLRALWFAATRQTTLKLILNLSFYIPLSTFALTTITSLAIGITTTKLTNSIIRRLNKNRLNTVDDDQEIDGNNNQANVQRQYYKNNPMLLPILPSLPPQYKNISGLIFSVGLMISSACDAYFDGNIFTVSSCVLNTLSATTTYVIKPIFTYYSNKRDMKTGH